MPQQIILIDLESQQEYNVQNRFFQYRCYMRKRWLKSSALLVVTAGLIGSDYAKAEENLGNDIFYDALFGFMHVRDNEDFLGHKNETNFRLTPNVAFGNFVFEGDFSFGKSSANSSPARDKIADVVNSQNINDEPGVDTLIANGKKQMLKW